MKFCPECGNKLIPGSKFCGECGYSIENKSTVKAPEHDLIYSSENINEAFIKKLTSEEYIIDALKKSHLNEFEITPNIDEKKAVNAGAVICDGIDPKTLLAIHDTTYLGNGKAGIAFLGNGIYLKDKNADSLYIPFYNFKNAELSEKDLYEDGKITSVKEIIIYYKNGNTLSFNSSQYTFKNTYKLLVDLLNNFNSNVDKISSNTQIVQLSQMSNHIIELYFRTVIAYLKDDDGIIDSKEYKELVSLMTKVNVKSEVAENLRKYRFENIESLTLDELVSELRYEVEKANFSVENVLQSLAQNIIGTHYDEIESIDENIVLVRMLDRLDISSKQLQFIVKNLKAERSILDKKLNDDQIKEIGKELAAIASGAGISMGALAVTGAVTGWGASLSGGLLALSMGSGGALIGVAAVATAGFGVYKGIKYFSGTSQLENYGIRMQALNNHITTLRMANNYIIEDINWLSNKTVEFAHKLKESNELSDQLYTELDYIITQNKAMADAGTLINDEQKKSELEMVLSSIPETLNVGKYNELLSKNIEKIYFDKIIMSVYQLEGDVDDQSELEHVSLRKNVPLEQLKDVYSALEKIGYFDTKSASIAQSKAVAKKGFSSFKKSLFENNKHE